MPDDESLAPDFTLTTDTGETLSLADLRGRIVVLYFYPKDDTPGCTLEAKDFSCLAGQFSEAGATVIGISPDSPASHARFRAKHELSVTLAADTDHKVAETFGVWTEKQMYGRRYMGVERSTFLIDTAGRIARSWRNVRVPGHAEEVLAAVSAVSPQKSRPGRSRA